mmetsp:Transcript_17478/g.61069  ORF Transcript_17478/g.61069 Transcript_17478/m.61069 type:complete len:217 (-) Transcript_17478:114-764(-)
MRLLPAHWLVGAQQRMRRRCPWLHQRGPRRLHHRRRHLHHRRRRRRCRPSARRGAAATWAASTRLPARDTRFQRCSSCQPWRSAPPLPAAAAPTRRLLLRCRLRWARHRGRASSCGSPVRCRLWKRGGTPGGISCLRRPRATMRCLRRRLRQRWRRHCSPRCLWHPPGRRPRQPPCIRAVPCPRISSAPWSEVASSLGPRSRAATRRRRPPPQPRE